MTWTTQPRSSLGDLAAIVTGNGPRVVLIHGVGLRAEAWRPIIDDLAIDFEVVAPDLPGHGASPFAGVYGTITDYAAALDTALTDGCVVVGHSMGAMLSLELATTYGDRVAVVCALNGIFEREEDAAEAVQARANDLNGENVPDPLPTLSRWFADVESEQRAACEAWLRAVSPRGYQAAYRVFAHANGPTREQLSALAMPALFMTGGREPNSTPAMSHAMAALAPKGRAEIVEDAAHMLPMTHPNRVTQALSALIAQASKE